MLQKSKKMKKVTINEIHIGSFIKAKAAERKITEVQLAKMIHCNHSTIHDIYNRKSINSEQLFKISEALEYDFFTEIYGKNLSEKVTSRQDFGTTTITITTEKISIVQDNGIVKIAEYDKNTEK